MLFRLLSVGLVASVGFVAMQAGAVDRATFEAPRKVRLIVRALDGAVTDEQVVECGVFAPVGTPDKWKFRTPRCEGQLDFVYKGEVHTIGFTQRPMSGFLGLQLQHPLLFKPVGGVGWTNWPPDEPELWRESKADSPIPMGEAAPILGDEQRREDPKPGESCCYLLTIGTVTAVPVQN